MKHIVLRPAWVLVLAAASLMGHAQAKNAHAKDGSRDVTSEKKKTVVHGPVSFHPGSEESTLNRSKRLQRECKGRVNAGACAGYTY